MDNTLYVGLSQQMALRRQMDILANNLANMNTNGFRSESVVFQEFMKSPGQGADTPLKDISFVQDYGLARNLREGDVSTTGNQLDLAISGKGYFVVDTGNGQQYYTRNGHFSRSSEGDIVTASGAKLLNADGDTINLPATESQFMVAADGSITTSTGPLGKIHIVTFENEQALKKVGNNLFSAKEIPTDHETPNLMQGALEQSNVQSIVEMGKMIQIMRAYQGSSRMMESMQDMRRDAIQKIGKVS